jgi:hypothetical protein
MRKAQEMPEARKGQDLVSEIKVQTLETELHLVIRRRLRHGRLSTDEALEALKRAYWRARNRLARLAKEKA